MVGAGGSSVIFSASPSLGTALTPHAPRARAYWTERRRCSSVQGTPPSDIVGRLAAQLPGRVDAGGSFLPPGSDAIGAAIDGGCEKCAKASPARSSSGAKGLQGLPPLSRGSIQPRASRCRLQPCWGHFPPSDFAKERPPMRLEPLGRCHADGLLVGCQGGVLLRPCTTSCPRECPKRHFPIGGLLGIAKTSGRLRR